MSGKVDGAHASDGPGSASTSCGDMDARTRPDQRGSHPAVDCWRVMMEAPVGLCLMSADGRVLEVNRSLCDFLGRDPEALKALRWTDVTHPDDVSTDRAQLDEIVAGRSDGYQHTKRFLFVDGGVRHGELAVTAIRNLEGGVDCFVAQIVDVTARIVAQDAAALASDRFRRLAEGSSDIVTVVDRSGLIEWVSPSVTATLGWSVDDYTGKSIADVLHPDDVVKMADVIARADEGDPTVRVRHRSLRADGSYRWLDSVVIVARDDAGLPVRADVTSRDVHDEVEALDTVEQARDRQHAILDSLIDPWVWLASIRDESGRIVDFDYVDANRAACLANGLTLPQLVGQTLLTLFPEHGPSGWFDAYAAVVETGEPLAADDVPFEHPGAGTRWFDNRAVKVGDGLSFTWRDVTDRYLVRDSLRDLAHHDALTGLPNRLDLHERLPDRLARAHPGSALAVLFCDVDEFKRVNDRYGHEVGDDVLREVARRMTATVRSNDYVARPGGDEFVILLDRVRDTDQAASVADKIREAVLAPMPLGSSTGQITLSIGVALVHDDADAKRIMTEADQALYRAKAGGRNRTCISETARGRQVFPRRDGPMPEQS